MGSSKAFKKKVKKKKLKNRDLRDHLRGMDSIRSKLRR